MRSVNSIDTSLDEDKYDPFILPTDKKTITGYLPDKADPKLKTAITFVNQKPVVTGRQSRADVLPQKPGITKHTKNIESPLDAFRFFLPI